MNQPVTLSAPAKINTHLLVEGMDSRSMHWLHTGFAYVDLCDKLTFAPDDQLTVTCSNPNFSGEHNLVYQVLNALKQQYRVDQGLSVHIEKYIPDQAGLGGGSSDAATALIYANICWNLRLDRNTLIEFATPYGADIPCFLFQQPSLARGVGEVLEPHPWFHQTPMLRKGYLFLAKPRSGLSTAAVFQRFDAIHHLTPETSADTMRRDADASDFIGMDSLPESPSKTYPFLGQNALESSATDLLPELGDLLARMKQYSDCAWMSGSGSTCIALCSEQEQTTHLSQQLVNDGFDGWTYSGRLLEFHPIEEELIGT